MPTDVAGSKSFLAQSGATIYPIATNNDGTATAGSSSAISLAGVVLDSIVIENNGSADGVLTISDHAGTAATDIVIALPLTTTPTLPRSITYGFAGISTGWTGIRAVTTGTGILARISFH